MRSPLAFWFSAWCTLLVLLVYGAEDLQSLTLSTPWLAERDWVHAATQKTMALSRAVGLARLHDHVEALRGEQESALPDVVARVAPPPVADPAAVEPGSTQPPAARRIMLLGASSMQFALGVELERLLSQRPGVVVERHGKASTGLARRDTIDWPVRAAAWIAAFQPDLVITNFGGNDAQAMTRPGSTPHSMVVLPFASEEWDRAYAERVDRIVDAAFGARSRVVMLGMPIMRQGGYSNRIAHVNAVTRQTVEARGGTYLSTWEMASDADGRYMKSLEWNGKIGPMRAPDGHHYTTFGGAYVAARIAEELERAGLLSPTGSP